MECPPEIGQIVELQEPSFGLPAGTKGRITDIQEHSIGMKLFNSPATMLVDTQSFTRYFERLICRMCDKPATRMYFDIPVCDQESCYEIALDTIADRD